jgi:succinylarginine dihydrolase
MDSKLRDKIAEALAVQGVTDGYICDKTKAIADSILALFAPELADAEKWRKAKEIATRHGNGIPCSDCDMMATCNNKGGSVCYMARTVVAALERDGVKG